jgi:hypothetical protein
MLFDSLCCTVLYGTIVYCTTLHYIVCTLWLNSEVMCGAYFVHELITPVLRCDKGARAKLFFLSFL